MLETPYELIKCSWPVPVQQGEGKWVSEPAWDTADMPYKPQPLWEEIDGGLCWFIDWRAFFHGNLRLWTSDASGEMRGFHVVFEIKIKHDGKLVFWDDDGSIIRRNRNIVHEDRSAHALQCSEITVKKGEHLQIAQWQLNGGWIWGAKFQSSIDIHDRTSSILKYLPLIRTKLQNPSGPALKMFTNGAQPLRSALAIYGLVLNGYAPSRILLYGEHQWTPEVRELFLKILPFVEIIPTTNVNKRIQQLGGHQLVDWARQYWWVMKTCVCLLVEPFEFCQIDDDVLVLESTADALQAFRYLDLVYAPDTDHGKGYIQAWLGEGFSEPLATARFNAGLYWARAIKDQEKIAKQMLTIDPMISHNFVWEQGFIACLYKEKGFELPSQKYFYPIFDGMPGGMHGYDYFSNPCGFTSVHFGGLREKPTDSACLHIVDGVLSRAELGKMVSGVLS